MTDVATVLTIAASDSGGAAGIQADLKTFAAYGVAGLTAITAITAQNRREITRIAPLAPDIVAAQIEAVASDYQIHAVKIGMLATGPIATAIATAIIRHRLKNVVIDPVMRSTSGVALLDDDGVEVLRSRLLPLAAVVTPNIAEAERLAGVHVKSLVDARTAAERIAGLGAKAVIVTGGHLDSAPIDLVYEAGACTELTGERLDTSRVHGTGCTFAAAVAARLALGDPVVDAARHAKDFVAQAIRRAPQMGQGRGPLGHL
jgi:hydroxymethylpyrimidine/phosphomethylpyrimidine kinase